MSAPVITRPNYADLYGAAMLPALQMLFNSELKRADSNRDRLFEKKRTDNQIWQYSELHDLALFEQVNEGSEYSFKADKAGSNKTLSVVKYGLGFSISEEAVADGQFDRIAQLSKKLAKSGMESQDIQAMNIFNNAFGSTTVADGLALCHTAHALPSGLTFRNKLATDSDLSESTLNSALVDVQSQYIGDSNIPYVPNMKYLLVPPDLRQTALRLVGSEHIPGSMNNDINTHKNEGLQVIVDRRLSDSDAWFLVASPNDGAEGNGLCIVERESMQMKFAGPDVGFKTDSIYQKAKYREIIGALHPYGIFGTPGAA